MLSSNEHDEQQEEEWLPVSNTDDISAADLRLWSLVLEARFIPYLVDEGPEGGRLLAPKWALATAQEEVRLFREENRNWPPPPPAVRPVHHNTLATLSVLLLLGTFHNIINLRIFPAIDFRAIGTADSTKIAAGEVWRAITALTLHAGAEHLAGNMAIGGIFIILLCRELGSGTAWLIILASGVFGNLVNAIVQTSQHLSIGASTAIFGALGALSALSIARHSGDIRKHWTIPAAAGLALLAVLGTEGKNTDLGAHLFGFLSGAVFGFAAEVSTRKLGSPGTAVNLLLASACATIVIAAWLIAGFSS